MESVGLINTRKKKNNINREKEIFVLEEKLNKIKSIFKNERMLQLTDMINEVEDVIREKNNEHSSYESESKSKDKDDDPTLEYWLKK